MVNDGMRTEIQARGAIALMVALCAAPIVHCLAYIYAYAVDVPLTDEWTHLVLFDHLYTGTLTLEQIVAQHADHRVAFPRLTMLALGHLTGFNVVADKLLSGTLFGLSAIVLTLTWVRAQGWTARSLVALVPAIWLLLSPRQYDNFLNGNPQWSGLFLLFVILTYVGISNSRGFDFPLLGAIWSAFIATYSHGAALPVWVIGAAQIVFIRVRAAPSGPRAAAPSLLAWIVAAAMTYALYFFGFAPMARPTVGSVDSSPPLEALWFLLTLLGSPLAVNGGEALVMGALLALVYTVGGVAAALALSRLSRTQSAYLAMFLHGLALTLLLTLSRRDAGLGRAMASWYVTLSGLAVVGTYLLAASSCRPGARLWRALHLAMAALMAVGIATGYPWGHQVGEFWRDRNQIRRHYLASFDTQSDQTLLELNGARGFVRAAAPILRVHRLSVFREPVTDRAGGEPSTVEPSFRLEWAVLGASDTRKLGDRPMRVAVDRGATETVTLVGWARDEATGSAAGQVWLSLEDGRELRAFYGLQRPDLAGAGDRAAARSGFLASFGTHILTPGVQRLAIKVVSADGTRYALSKPVVELDVR